MKNKDVNSSRIPVYRDAGFELFDAETTAEAFRKETENEREPDLYIYSRYRNPTVVAAEEEIMKLEESEWALLTQSGMSAIDTALSIFHRGKDTRPWLFFSEIYGGTLSFIESVLKRRRGINIQNFTATGQKYDLDYFETTIKSLQPELVYIESISNPMLIVPDASEIILIAHHHGAKVIVDNTFATPLLWRPLQAGADLVMHSATKYFSGHGNITAGVICGNDHNLMNSAVEYRKYTGHMISPDDAYRLHTQIMSLELRFRQQCHNANIIAKLLKESLQVKRVLFPGLTDHPTHAEAVKLFNNKGFGAMITLEFDGEDEKEKRSLRDTFIRAVSDKIKLIPSLGDHHTILLPIESVWGAKYPEPGMIRLSVGFENTDDLTETIHKGLKSSEL